MVQFKRVSRRMLGAAALVAIIAGVVVYPVLAVDFDGDRTGETLIAGDNIFNFLAGFTGTNIIVQTTDPDTTLDFTNAPTGIAVDLSNTTTYQTVYAGLSIWFQGFITPLSTTTIDGSAYSDTLTGGNANAKLNGGTGDDTLNGGTGNDQLNGGAGDDVLNGGVGEDRFIDISNNDMTVNLATGTATGNGTDTMSNIEEIITGGGNDTLTSNSSTNSQGATFIDGGGGNDTLIGDSGRDIFNGGDGDDVLNGGGGDQDRFYDASNNDMTVDLAAGTAAGNGSDTLISIENAVTGSGNDTLIGDSNDNRLLSGEGNDTITGGGGSDTINGGTGTDTLTDTNAADCAGDTVVGIETNNCLAVVPPVIVPVIVQPQALTPELCITSGTRVSVDGGKLLIFSGFGDHNPNGMTITHIPLGSLRNPTDEEKASGIAVLLAYKDSEFAPGWSAAVYWKENHYGVVVYKDGGKTVFEDTGAICGWF